MFSKFLSSLVIAVTSLFAAPTTDVTHVITVPSPEATPVANVQRVTASKTSNDVIVIKTVIVNPPKVTATKSTKTTAPAPITLSNSDLFALADDKYADGDLPVGDDKYVTSGPKKGYIYLCNVRKDNPGSQVTGSWIHGDTWNIKEKVAVEGSVSWPDAQFSDSVSGTDRVLSGNGLPVDHVTGVFPVEKGTKAAIFDPNPNTISAQNLRDVLPVNPIYSDTPYCMGGEVGVMLSGVPLFNGFDAGLRDAAAHEVQDSCEGHPQGSGEYHYHSLSSCFKDINVATVIGYALDGFPITGPMVAHDKYLTTEDLDVCHGIISDVVVDGNKKTTYHYVMTEDFPYSASCFRGKPITNTPPKTNQSAPVGQTMPAVQNTPPKEAISVCVGKVSGDDCGFVTPGGPIAGMCQLVPEGAFACVPKR